ncbi:MAG: membrane protein insertase YidC, partial [Flavobacteriaceae bacterium]|nr:membrane protein insertase YidC [Flavobacteriaceae bacterium]
PTSADLPPEQETRNTQNDSLNRLAATAKYGAFAASQLQTEETLKLENDVLRYTISTKGAQIVEAVLKNHTDFRGDTIYLIKDGNASFNMQFTTIDGRTLNTKDLNFIPNLTQGESPVLELRLETGKDAYIAFRYGLKPGEYMTDFSIRSKGMNAVLNTATPVEVQWGMTTYRLEKSVSYENRYTELIYEYEGGKDDYLAQRTYAEDTEQQVSYISFKQHFFNTTLLTDKPFQQARLVSENLVADEAIDTLVTKRFAAQFPLEFSNGDLDYTMNLYSGPTDFQVLNAYDRNLDEIVPLGWGIFGWINKWLFIPLFTFLSSTLGNYGISIILMTIIVRIVLSPVLYKSYLAQAKMKILRPEINKISEKYKDNPMKRQQETMRIQSESGASPLSGCLPGLMQLPVFYALFMFFPSAFVLRQKGFLWAEDLASYDTIFNLPFHVWFYGDHVSLFPILASIAILIYMMMTTGDTMQQSQPGMPNMKFLIYLSPIFMLIFFNNYASGLSLYYFISNLITIGIMLVIKNFIIKPEKVLAKIEAHRQKPKKQGRFSRKLKQIMEEAERQQKQKK